MMKKNKLYTINKRRAEIINRPAFMPKEENLFAGPFGSSQMTFGNQVSLPSLNTYLPKGLSNDTYRSLAIGSAGQMQNAFQNYGKSVIDNFGKGPLTQNNSMLSQEDPSKFFGINSSKGSGSGSSGGGGGSAMTTIGAAVGALDSVQTGDPRGMWDTLDPVYHLAGGRESAAGNAMSDAGVAVTKAGLSSGQPWMALAGAGLKIVGGLTNAAFGIKENTALKRAVEEGINRNNNFVSKARTFDDVRGPIASVSNTNVWEGGWFSGGKARRKNEELKKKMIAARQWAGRSVDNNIFNLQQDQWDNAMRNFAAFGGPLDYYSNDNMNAVNYGFMSDYLTQKKRESDMKSRMGGIAPMPAFMPNNFAIGGDLQTHGSDWSTGLVTIGAGGTHEENKYDGVQLGKDMNSVPNLVEEGETVWNDYVFSNRILADETTKQMFHLPKKRDITFADISKKLEKEIAERPNDPISRSGFKSQMQTLEEQQERQKQEMEAARAREAFEALSPEEQTAVMQNVAQQEAMAQQATQEQAMQEEALAAQQQPLIAQEGNVIAQQADGTEAEVMPATEGYAYGGNLFDDGGYKGALAWLNKEHPTISEHQKNQIAKVMAKRISDRYKTGIPKDIRYSHFYNGLGAGIIRNERALKDAFLSLVSDGMDPGTALNVVARSVTFSNSKIQDKEVWQKRYKDWTAETATSTRQAATPQRKTTWGSTSDGIKTRTLSNGTTQYLGNDGKYHLTEKDAKATFTAAPTSSISLDGKPTEDRRATREADAVGSTSGTSTRSQGSRSSVVPHGKGINVGPWNDGKDFAQHWQEYAAPGLDAFLTQLEEDYNNADSEEKRAEILSKGMEDFNNLQDSYYKYILPGRGQTSFTKDDNVWNHQTEWNRMKGNTGFWSESDDGSSINKIAKAIDLPRGHHTTDTPSGNGIDGYNGAQTSLRTMGTTEAGDASYYAPYAERFKKLGLNFSPYDNWSYGDDLSKKLYRLSPITATSDNSEAAVGNGLVEGIDYMVPEEEEGDVVAAASPEEDDFVELDENGNPVTNRKIVPIHRKDWLRYAGLFGPAVGLGMQMAGIGKPDTASLDAAISGAGNVYTADYQPIGNYLTYRPLDIWYEQNRANALSRATDRNIMNTSGGNRGTAMAGLIANGLNSQIASGNLFRQAEESNLAQRERVEAFNRGTNQFNAEAYNRNSQFNASERNRANQYAKQLALHAAAQKMNADAGWYNGIYGNVAGLFRGLADLGRENYQHNQMVDVLASGALPVTEQKLVDARLARYAKEGGEIKRKKSKRGLTI